MIEQIFLILAFLISCFVFSERPLWGIALMLVFSTRNFYLIEMSGLPTLSLGGKMELQMYDLVLGALLIVTILKVQQRSQKLLFRKSYIVLFIVIFFSFIYSMMLPSFEFKGALNTLRKFLSYSFYYVLVVNIRKEEDIKKIINLIFSLTVIAIVIQLYEVLTDSRIIIGDTGELRPYWDLTVKIELSGGEKVSYIWNRAVLLSFLTLFLSIGALFSIKKMKLTDNSSHIIMSIVGMSVFILALSRSWFLYIAVSIFSMLIIERRSRVVISLMVIIIAIFFIDILSANVSESLTRVNIIDRLVQRFFSVFDVFSGSNTTFNIRLAVLAHQFELFLQKPFFGYGFTEIARQEYNSDIGFFNTLLQFGIVGCLWVFTFIVQFYKYSLKIYNKMTQTIWKGYALGLIGAWTGMMVGYAFNWDFFGRLEGIIAISFMFAMIEKLNMFFVLEQNKVKMTLQ